MNDFFLALNPLSARILLAALAHRMRVLDRYDRNHREEYLECRRMVQEVEAYLYAAPEKSVPEKMAGHVSTGSGV